MGFFSWIILGLLASMMAKSLEVLIESGLDSVNGMPEN